MVLGESLVTQTLLLTMHQDDIDTRPLPGSFVTFSVDWTFLIIALMVEMGIVHCSSSFLKATSLICDAQLSFAAHPKYNLVFFSLWWMEFGLFYISVKQEAMPGKVHVHSHPGVLKIVNMNVNTSEIFYSYKFLGVPILVSNVYLRKIFI